MEIGAVLGAAPRRAVIRETSDPDDIIILLGGRTGRDGCGGAAIARGDVGAAALAYLYLNADGESADVEEIAGEFSCPVRQVKRAVALLSRSLDEVNETGIQE